MYHVIYLVQVLLTIDFKHPDIEPEDDFLDPRSGSSHEVVTPLERMMMMTMTMMMMMMMMVTMMIILMMTMMIMICFLHSKGPKNTIGTRGGQ